MFFSVVPVEHDKFGAYYLVYAGRHIFDTYDWNDMLGSLTDAESFFVMDRQQIVGGFLWSGNQISCPFIAPPFMERDLFWKQILGYAAESGTDEEVAFEFIAEPDASVLVRTFGARLISKQRRMLRPTSGMSVVPPDGFLFAEPSDGDREDIIKAVFEAHSAGYTSTVRVPDLNEIRDSIDRRYVLFSQTNTLHFSTLVRDGDSGILAGVCLAGIYPGSPNCFATIHQVSVVPQFRRRGIAGAMMLNTISKAATLSPVITLGVMIGNPAEFLYRKIGFSGCSEYAELNLTLSIQ